MRTPFNYDIYEASNETALTCPEPTLAQQHFAEECDINTIVKRFGLTGELPANVRMPVNADFEDIYDFHSAMNQLRTAQESFDKMPAHIRARFHNNPAEFVDFCSNDENRLEAVRLGLIPAPAPVPPAVPPGPAEPPKAA